jgi:hypothetical protein
MSTASNSSEFHVNIMVQAAGPIRPRTKYKRHRLLRAEARIVLPFAPYPGLYLTFSKPKKRGMPVTMYLRVRAVKWNVTDRQFECVADEILGSDLFSELHEIRGSSRIEEHFVELQDNLRTFGFEVSTDVDGMVALHKREDGIVFDGVEPIRE